MKKKTPKQIRRKKLNAIKRGLCEISKFIVIEPSVKKAMEIFKGKSRAYLDDLKSKRFIHDYYVEVDNLEKNDNCLSGKNWVNLPNFKEEWVILDVTVSPV